MLHLIWFVSQGPDYLERCGGDSFGSNSTIVIKPEVGERIYWTMVSIDTFGLVGATSAPSHAQSASAWIAHFVISQTADSASLLPGHFHIADLGIDASFAMSKRSFQNLRRI
jgi:hypothetical protein